MSDPAIDCPECSKFEVIWEIPKDGYKPYSGCGPITVIPAYGPGKSIIFSKIRKNKILGFIVNTTIVKDEEA